MTLRINDYYRVLELPLDATPEDIRFRYRQLARVYHPDRYSDPDDKEFVEAMMKRINEAYNALSRSPQPPQPQPTIPTPPPTIYRTVKGTPIGLTIMLVGIAFLLGALTVQLFNFAPFSNALGSNIRTSSSIAAAAQVNSEPVQTLVHIGNTSTAEATATTSSTSTAASSFQTPVGEALVMATNGVSGAFPVSSNSQTTALEEAASATPAPTATATETPTAEPTATPSPLPTDTAPPAPTDTIAPTDTTAPTATELPVPATATPVPVLLVNTQSASGGVLMTINVEYNVFARSTTSIQSEPVALLSIGEQVIVVGRTLDNYWLRVVLGNGQMAWVYAETIGADTAVLNSLPVVE